MKNMDAAGNLTHMNKIHLKVLRKQLMKWYLANKRDLPWRRSQSPYAIWVSEVMLQQTRVNTVIDYYRNFLKTFPNLKQLAQADLQSVLKVWEGMGYYGRARNLHRAAKIIRQEHGGRIPDRWDAIRSLPGVGDYIASAVLSIAYGRAYAVVDGNVKRVLARLYKIEAPVNQSSAKTVFESAANKILDPQQPGIFNQAVMELGALVCRPRNPSCNNCPLNTFCSAYLDGQVTGFPKRRKQKATPQYHITVGVVYKNDRVLITQRKAEGLLGGLWEFPGGKIKEDESPQAACIREIKEEVNLDVSIDRHLTQVKHAYTHFKIVMEVFCCRYVSGRVYLRGPVAYRWIRLDEYRNYPFPKANHKFLPLLTKDDK